jgi:Glycosyltransferase family 87
VFAAVTCVTGMPAQRIWAYWAVGAYLLGSLGLAFFPRAQWLWVIGVTLTALVGPLTQLSLNWQGQHEIWLVQHAAERLVNSDPLYPANAQALADINHYFPYLPAMALLGLPSWLAQALELPQLLTDVRWTMALVYAALAAITIRDFSGDRARAWLWFVASPVAALPLATGGDDLPVIGLLLLALTLSRRRQSGAAGVAAGLACAAKLTAWPVAVALAVMTLAGSSPAQGRRFTLTWLGVTATFVMPVVILEPHGLYLHEFAYPAGLAPVRSPAASPFPGHLLADTFSAGSWIALGLLAACAAGLSAWLVWRPPLDDGAVAWFSAAALGVATLLMPASRAGYVIYPILLALCAIHGRADVGERQPKAGATSPAMSSIGSSTSPAGGSTG